MTRAPLLSSPATYVHGITPHTAAGLPFKGVCAVGGLGETLGERDNGTPPGQA